MNNIQSSLSRAIFIMLVAIFLFDIMGAIIKYLGTRYPVQQLSVYRNLFGVIPSIIILYFSKQWHSDGRPIYIRQWRLGLLRGCAGTFAQFCFYLSLVKLEFATASAIAFCGPLFITVLSIPLLKHRVGYWRWSAVAIGFCGVVLVMKPTSDVFTLYALLPICAALGYATISVSSRLFDESLPTAVINIYAVAGTLVSSALVLFTTSEYVTVISTQDWLLLLAMGSAGGAAVFCLIYAYRLTEPSNLSPFEYFGIPMSFIIGWVIFNEAPFDRLIPGVFLIIAGGLVIVWRERALGK